MGTDHVLVLTAGPFLISSSLATSLASAVAKVGEFGSSAAVAAGWTFQKLVEAKKRKGATTVALRARGTGRRPALVAASTPMAATTVATQSSAELRRVRPTYPPPTVARPTAGRPTVARPTAGRPTVARPTAGRPTVARPTA